MPSERYLETWAEFFYHKCVLTRFIGDWVSEHPTACVFGDEEPFEETFAPTFNQWLEEQWGRNAFVEDWKRLLFGGDIEHAHWSKVIQYHANFIHFRLLSRLPFHMDEDEEEAGILTPLFRHPIFYGLGDAPYWPPEIITTTNDDMEEDNDSKTSVYVTPFVYRLVAGYPWANAGLVKLVELDDTPMGIPRDIKYPSGKRQMTIYFDDLDLEQPVDTDLVLNPDWDLKIVGKLCLQLPGEEKDRSIELHPVFCTKDQLGNTIIYAVGEIVKVHSTGRIGRILGFFRYEDSPITYCVIQRLFRLRETSVADEHELQSDDCEV